MNKARRNRALSSLAAGAGLITSSFLKTPASLGSMSYISTHGLGGTHALRQHPNACSAPHFALKSPHRG